MANLKIQVRVLQEQALVTAWQMDLVEGMAEQLARGVRTVLAQVLRDGGVVPTGTLVTGELRVRLVLDLAELDLQFPAPEQVLGPVR